MKKLLVIGLLLVVAGCASKPETQYVPQVVEQQKQRAAIAPPPPLRLESFVVDVPRDVDGKPLKSNVFVGFDFANWRKFWINWERLKARELMWQERLKAANERSEVSK